MNGPSWANVWTPQSSVSPSPAYAARSDEESGSARIRPSSSSSSRGQPPARYALSRLDVPGAGRVPEPRALVLLEAAALEQ